MFAKHLMLHRQLLACAFVIGALLGWSSAHAGISYQINQTQAATGTRITIDGVFFNDTGSALTFSAPQELNLQWRNPDNEVVHSQAQLQDSNAAINVPANSFMKYHWQTTVPKELQPGLQTIAIEGAPSLLALNASPSTSNNNTDALAYSPNIAPEKKLSLGGLSSHEPVYFDIGNRGGTNARYQVSFKYRLFTPLDPAQPDFVDNFYFGYTQTALWDLSARSKPFIDTSFKPSFFWRQDALWQSPEKNWFIGLATGIEHESNGKGGIDSRSLNFAYIQPELNYRFDGGSTLSFSPRIKTYFKVAADNSDYRDYAGNVDWRLRYAQDKGLVLTGLYRSGRSGHNATTLEAAWPLRRTFLNMNGYLHVQYFQGYGQTLLGYNKKNKSQVRIGLALVP